MSTIGPNTPPTLPPTIDPIAAGDRVLEYGGGGVYDPATEAGVILDLWAEAGVTQAGTGVSSWVDRKGSKDFAQGTDANRPTYEAAGLGGKPSVLWVKANSDALVCASGPSSTTKSYSLIAALDPVTNNASEWFLDAQTGRIIFAANSQGVTSLGWYDGAHDAIAASTLPPQIVRWKLTNGGNGEIFRGNTSLGTAAYTGVNFGGAVGLGSDYLGTGGFCDVRVGRAILCDTLDDTRDARIMAYLSAHYGIAL